MIGGCLATVNSVSDKWVLVIDDLEGMRSQLRMTLSTSGFAKLHVVSRIKDALERMAEHRYDIILCDYFLGDSTNGQQFLEYLRTNDLISRNTIFVMITAEQSYEKVVVASECAPDDYLLKPFTAGQFNARLHKLLEKQNYLESIDQATDSKNWQKVIVECDRRLPARDKYFLDLCKIKGAALMRENRAHEAVDLYQQVIQLRPIGWARLGLARALAMQGKNEEALALLRQLLKDSPQFMAAYDFMSRLLAQSGDKEQALDVLQQARTVSPGTMSRVRTLSSLAVSTGKPEIAESVMRETLARHKHSPVRQANDYAVLSKALVDQGKAVEALSVLDDAKKDFRDDLSSVMLAASECVAHRKAGNLTLAEEALARSMTMGDASKLPPQAIVALAEACFAMDKENEATDLLRQAIQNNHEDSSLKGKVHEVLTMVGKDPAEATALIEVSVREVVMINNDGVRKADAGEFEAAIKLLNEAASRLPNNMQIVGNAALVLALDMVRNGVDANKLRQCLVHRDAIMARFPAHQTLLKINGLLRRINKAGEAA